MEPSAGHHHLLVHYNEIALKGKNRGYFEERLVDSIRLALAGLGCRRARRLQGRLLVEIDGAPAGELPWTEVRRRLERVFGISHFARAHRSPPDLEALRRDLLESIGAIPRESVGSFAIDSRRADKRFPLNSVELNRELGRAVQERTGWKVSIDAPELPIHVYILKDAAYFTFERCAGPGGLPRGAAGRVVCLISGGIDSPVAAHRMMRRGCVPIFVHFHSFPHTGRASIDKVRELVESLTRERGGARLHLVPLADLQRKIITGCPAPYRVILYRRFMMRAAEAIARRERALGLVTGDALGQVASQTLENLASVGAAVTIPVFRPLIGLDKLEIVREAEAIGTFRTSIEPHDDCCGFLMPRNPATRSRPEDLDRAEEGLEVAAEVRALLERTEVLEIGRAAASKPAADPISSGSDQHPGS